MTTINKILPVLVLVLALIPSCKTVSDSNEILEDIQENLEYGNVKTVDQVVDSLNHVRGIDKEILHIADSLRQIADRIKLDFSVTPEQFNVQTGDSVSANDLIRWDKNGWIEWRFIDGEKRYFNRAASNLRLIRKFYGDLQEKDTAPLAGSEESMRLSHTTKIFNDPGKLSNPVKMKVVYTLTVEPDAVPPGEKVRCWLPWPKKGFERQQDISLISTSEPKYSFSPDSSAHSTIYMEKTAEKGLPVVFQISYSYVSYGFYINILNQKIDPYDRNSLLFQEYTKEQLPHICFNDNIKHLADSLAAGEIDPRLIVGKIYSWFKENIPWAGAQEYSIIPNIPEYVIKYKRGDCGMQTFLLLSMLRYKGVPSRWQSGWMMQPDHENLHDWCEVYYEGIGWIPCDVTYDLQNSENNLLKYFFMSGIDTYRLIINSGVAGKLYPEKKFMRSEPYDFQRGEVEWKGGNLYFNRWDYDMKIEYEQ
jgi:hypothetical protein